MDLAKSTRRTALAAMGCAVLAIAAGLQTAAAAELELMHFWTSGGEAAAMDVIRKGAQAAGIQWKDAAVAGGSGMNAFQVLQARVAAGNPPAAMQMHGEQIKQYADAGLLLDLTDVATAQGWDSVVDVDLLPYYKINGKVVGIPFNMHRPNWIWANKPLLDRYGGKVPTTWTEFFAIGDKMKADGIIPLATGGQPWQDLLLFELVLLGDEGKEFHKAALGELKPDAINSPQMVKALETYRKVLSYSDPNRANRDWNLATAMVIKGDAAFQIMGDWANGEFLKAGRVAGKDYLCGDTPGTAGLFMWNADFWGFFRGLNADGVEAQKRLAIITMDKKTQRDFNIIKGSSPARTDVGTDGFTGCGLKAVQDRAQALASGNMIGSFAQNSGRQPPEVRGVFEDVINQYGNDPSMTPQAAIDKITAGLKAL
jgi:glucose/mannose transport system substrate-binding protein